MKLPTFGIRFLFFLIAVTAFFLFVAVNSTRWLDLAGVITYCPEVKSITFDHASCKHCHTYELQDHLKITLPLNEATPPDLVLFSGIRVKQAADRLEFGQDKCDHFHDRNLSWVWSWQDCDSGRFQRPEITGYSRQILFRRAPAPKPGLTWILSATSRATTADERFGNLS
jgi:hypothetical protein